MSVPLTKPNFGPEEEAAVLEALRSGWVTQGPMVARFEQAVASYVGAKHGVAVSSCTTALHLALLALGVGPGDEVIVPSHTFIATANAAMYVGATPVFVDIRPETYSMDPALIEAAITPRTKAIIPVHQGVSADMDEISAIAAAHGLAVVEDAAPAIGCDYRGRKIGSGPHMVCFSFHPRKIITSGEGGMVMTDDDALAERLRRLRHHGMSVSDLARHQSDRPIFEEYLEVGYNFRMTDLQAALGLAQFAKLDAILAERRRLAAIYDEALQTHLPWLLPPHCPADRTHSYQSYLARVSPDAPISRDDLMARLLTKGIATRRGFMSIHREPAYRDRVPGLTLIESERATDEAIILPLYPGMDPAAQAYVIETLRAI